MVHFISDDAVKRDLKSNQLKETKIKCRLSQEKYIKKKKKEEKVLTIFRNLTKRMRKFKGKIITQKEHSL